MTAIRRAGGAVVALPDTAAGRQLERQVAVEHLHAVLLEELSDAMPGASNERVVATAARVRAAVLRDLRVAFLDPPGG